MKNLRTFTDESFSAGLSSPVWDFVKFPNSGNDPYDDNGDEDIWDLDNVNGTYNGGYPFLAWQNGASQALPVQLSSFTANYKNNSVVLNWTTGSLAGGLGFTVDRLAGQNGEWQQIASYLTDNTLVSMNNSIGQADYSYTDENFEKNKLYCYRLCYVNIFGNSTVLDVIDVLTTGVNKDFPTAIPEDFSLIGVYPNPFNPQTTIAFQLPRDEKVSLRIYNIKGEQIKELVNDFKRAGFLFVEWDGKDFGNNTVNSGIYFIFLQAGDYSAMKKVTLLR